jgi:hypothetical protein
MSYVYRAAAIRYGSEIRAYLGEFGTGGSLVAVIVHKRIQTRGSNRIRIAYPHKFSDVLQNGENHFAKQIKLSYGVFLMQTRHPSRSRNEVDSFSWGILFVVSDVPRRLKAESGPRQLVAGFHLPDKRISAFS